MSSRTPDDGTQDVQTSLTDGVTDNIPVDTTGGMSNRIGQEPDARTSPQMTHVEGG